MTVYETRLSAPGGRISPAAFDAYALLPENTDKLLEFITGEIVEVPSNARASEYGLEFAFYIKLYLKANGVSGHVTGEAGGYQIGGERYAPDVAYVSGERQTELDGRGYNSVPPELAVEVEYPLTFEALERLKVKIGNYLAAGVVVWAVFPEKQRVEVYAPGLPVQVLGPEDVLTGGDVLPGFTLALAEIFTGQTNEQHDSTDR